MTEDKSKPIVYKHGFYKAFNGVGKYWCDSCQEWIFDTNVGFPTNQHWFSQDRRFICNAAKPQGESNMTSPENNIYGSVHGERNFLTGDTWCERCHRWIRTEELTASPEKHWFTGSDKQLFVCGKVPAYTAPIEMDEMPVEREQKPKVKNAPKHLEVNEILVERGKTYARFLDNSTLSQALKVEMWSTNNWRVGILAADQKEALELIALKISRILTGNPDHVDSWDDIAGYAMLVSKRLKGESL
jgi:Domain of unknown function (DUF6378)